MKAINAERDAEIVRRRDKGEEFLTIAAALGISRSRATTIYSVTKRKEQIAYQKAWASK